MRSNKVFILIIITLLILLIFAGFGCRDKGIELHSSPTIAVSIDEIGVTEVWLRVKFSTQTGEQRVFKLKRDGRVILTTNNSPSDTVFLDDNLLPKHTYNYKVYKWINNIAVDSSKTLVLTTMDTTTHDYTWQIDSLGGTQSYVDGLWGSDENNVYAVGHFTSDSGATPHIAYWDGSKWSYLKPDAVNGINGIQAGDLVGVFGVSSNKIWVAGYGYGSNVWGPDTNWGYVAEWDGKDWKNISPNAPGEYFISVWASSENDVWVTTMSGFVYHRIYGNWEKLNTGTDYYFSDIWGFSNKEIYITGFPMDYSTGIVLKYNGENWERINVLPPSSIVSFKSVWGTSNKYLFVASDGGLFTNHKGMWVGIGYPGLRSALNLVRGTAKNNIFIVGHVGKILHYNGYSYQNYETQFAGSNGWIVKAIQVFPDKVFIGTSGGVGFNRRGIVLRGRK